MGYVIRMKGAYWVYSPGCPRENHPTRWCNCKAFRYLRDAKTYMEGLNNDWIEEND